MGNNHSTENANNFPLEQYQQPLIGDNASNANLHITNNNFTVNFATATSTMEHMNVGEAIMAGVRLNDEQIRSNIVDRATNFVDAVAAVADGGVPKDPKVKTLLAEVGALSAPESVHAGVTLMNTRMGKVLTGAVLTGPGHALICTGGAVNVLGIHFLSDALSRYQLEGKFRQDMIEVLDSAILRFEAVLDEDFEKDFSNKGREKAKNVFKSHIKTYQQSILEAGKDIKFAKDVLEGFIEIKNEEKIIICADRLLEKIQAYYKIYSQFGKMIENATKQACALAEKSRRRALYSFLLALINGAGLCSVYSIANVTNVYTAVIFGGICVASIGAGIYMGCKFLKQANIADAQVKELKMIDDQKNKIQKDQETKLEKTMDDLVAGSSGEIIAERRKLFPMAKCGANAGSDSPTSADEGAESQV